jgi:MFS superfamily sulfate permease-like transporter
MNSTSTASWLVPQWMWGTCGPGRPAASSRGVTLAAVALSETMGHSSIAKTALVTGLSTVLPSTIAFALLGSSRLLVVGAEPATAAALAAGLAGLAVAGLTPGSFEWRTHSSLTELMIGSTLVLARRLWIAFIADVLSALVLIGFLTEVGSQMDSRRIEDWANSRARRPVVSTASGPASTGRCN